MESRHDRTQRSHEENQERAYIAASRRGDRSIEARVQSARMASDMHKKRTGRGLKISKDVVTNQEMHEEENDELPRSYRLLGANMQRLSGNMNASLEAYLGNKIEISKMLAKANQDWRENEINRLFAQSFPSTVPAKGYSQETCCPKSYYPAPRIAAKAAASPNLTSITQPHRAIPNRRRFRASSTPTSRNRRHSLMSTPRPANAPGSELSTTPTTPTTGSSFSPQTPADIAQLSGFALKTELPPEGPMVLGKADDDAAMVQILANEEIQELQEILECQAWLNTPARHKYSEMLKTTQQNEIGPGLVPVPYGNCSDKITASSHPLPCTPDYESWQAFINDSIWTTD